MSHLTFSMSIQKQCWKWLNNYFALFHIYLAIIKCIWAYDHYIFINIIIILRYSLNAWVAKIGWNKIVKTIFKMCSVDHYGLGCLNMPHYQTLDWRSNSKLQFAFEIQTICWTHNFSFSCKWRKRHLRLQRSSRIWQLQLLRLDWVQLKHMKGVYFINYCTLYWSTSNNFIMYMHVARMLYLFYSTYMSHQ